MFRTHGDSRVYREHRGRALVGGELRRESREEGVLPDGMLHERVGLVRIADEGAEKRARDAVAVALGRGDPAQALLDCRLEALGCKRREVESATDPFEAEREAGALVQLDLHE